MKELSLYIHIPFCMRKCLYCDFLSFPVGNRSYVNRKEIQNGGKSQKKNYGNQRHTGEQGAAGILNILDYVNLLCREIVLLAQAYKKYQVISIFFGGGTPSLLSAEEMGKIMDAVRASFVLAEDAEITVECNPGTVDREKLAYYITLGINRLSIGLQSANDDELARIGRIHDYETFLRTYRAAREAGFSNINVDLMTALPGQTAASYQKTLMRVCDLSPEHISAYSLILEEGTPLYVNQKEYTFPDEDEERELYYMTERVLSMAGYHRYEISNYAREGRECRHNKVYWRRGDYLGLGLGAASMVRNIRWKNPDGYAGYTACVEKLAADDRGKPAVAGEKQAGPPAREWPAGTVGFAQYLRKSGFQEVQVLSRQEQMEEFMFLGLRLMEGVEASLFMETFGVSVEAVYGEVIERLAGQDLLVHTGERLFLTARGIDVSNQVFTAFLF